MYIYIYIHIPEPPPQRGGRRAPACPPSCQAGFGVRVFDLCIVYCCY